MKKIIVIGFILVMLAFTLGCTKEIPPTDQTSEKPTVTTNPPQVEENTDLDQIAEDEVQIGEMI